LQGVVDAAASTDDAAPVEDLARKERRRIMELIESQGMLPGSYPKFDVAVKGQKVVLPPLIFELYCRTIFGTLQTLVNFSKLCIAN
jgi:hypothetical protein